MYSYTIKTQFDAAHELPFHKGKCSNLHGHTWRVEAKFWIPVYRRDGIGHDFAMLKEIVNRALPDHEYLNDLKELKGTTTRNSIQPTAETLVDVLRQRIVFVAHKIAGACIPSIDTPQLIGLTLWESDECAVAWIDTGPELISNPSDPKFNYNVETSIGGDK